MANAWRNGWNLAVFFWAQRVRGFDVPSEPHFDAESTKWFRAALERAGSYLEFGAGGSTLLADRLGKPTVSIESDRFFAAAVRKKLSAGTTVRLHPVDIGLVGPWGKPVRREATPERLAKWRRYSTAPFALLGNGAFPDLVLIDGRFRRACALQTVHEAQKRGARTTIMLDDYDTAEAGHDTYTQVEALLGTPRMVGRAAIFDSADARPVDEAAILAAVSDIA